MYGQTFRNIVGMSLPVRGAWIEIEKDLIPPKSQRSLPVRGAWIEIVTSWDADTGVNVAPRAGSVD